MRREGELSRVMLWHLEKADEVTCEFSLLLGPALAFAISFPACPAEMLSQAFPGSL